MKDDPRFYMHVAGNVRSAIVSGDLSPGKPLLSIGKLAAVYQCSRRTAGHAMQVLADEGLIVRVPGLGWYVEDPLPESR